MTKLCLYNHFCTAYACSLTTSQLWSVNCPKVGYLAKLGPKFKTTLKCYKNTGKIFFSIDFIEIILTKFITLQTIEKGWLESLFGLLHKISKLIMLVLIAILFKISLILLYDNFQSHASLLRMEIIACFYVLAWIYKRQRGTIWRPK